MRLTIMIAVIFCLFAFAESTLAQTSAANKTIDAYIRKESKSQGADEYREGRKMVFGDVDRDGDMDALVQYTIEGMGGGNSFAQMLAIFINRKGVYKFVAEEVVGGKFAYRTSELTGIENGRIVLSTESCPEPPQGLCDNPEKGKAIFTFSKGKLKEL